MSNFSEQQKARDKKETRDSTRREKLAGYFYDLSKLIFAALVLGGITPIFTNDTDVNWITVCAGIFATYIFANFANRILK